MSDLKPCPFCGGEAYHDSTSCWNPEEKEWIPNFWHQVICKNCGTQTKVFFTEAEAIEAWNRRTEPKWIPVTERFPKKENKSYWVCTDTKHQCECRWTNNIYGIGESNNWGWKIFDIPQYTKVVAWMPLPEPWRGE